MCNFTASSTSSNFEAADSTSVLSKNIFILEYIIYTVWHISTFAISICRQQEKPQVVNQINLTWSDEKF